MFVRSHDYCMDINFEISKVSIPAIYKNQRIDINGIKLKKTNTIG